MYTAKQYTTARFQSSTGMGRDGVLFLVSVAKPAVVKYTTKVPDYYKSPQTANLLLGILDTLLRLPIIIVAYTQMVKTQLFTIHLQPPTLQLRVAKTAPR